MPTTFLHLADVHLGYYQYQSEERLKDFSRAFRQTVEDAIDKKVDFVLIAGDLFHKANINPPTLLQAKRPLEQLRQANIPAIAINGNHDAVRYGNQFSWLDYLEADDCLTVLKPTFSKSGQLELAPSNGRSGGYIDLNGVRVVGLPYLGASTTSVLTELPDVLKTLPQNHHFTVLMAHFGLEGEVPNMNGTVSHNIIAPLKGHVNYLALGHIHKPVERDNWIYNPGSLEACGMDERLWHGGWYHITVGDNGHQAKHIRCKRRPMHRIRIEVDKFANPQTLYDAVRSDLEDYNRAIKLGDLKPVVQVWLDGVLAFDRHDLDTNFIEQIIIDVINPLKAIVRNNTRSTEYEVVIEDRLDWAELERNVFTDLIVQDSRYRDRAEAWAKLISEVKTMALANHEAEDIAKTIIRQMALIEDAPGDVAIDTLKSKLTALKSELEG
jgi:DNA repair exonuclease SbcCD nuclease subunit